MRRIIIVIILLLDTYSWKIYGDVKRVREASSGENWD